VKHWPCKVGSVTAAWQHEGDFAACKGDFALVPLQYEGNFPVPTWQHVVRGQHRDQVPDDRYLNIYTKSAIIK